MAMEHVIQEMKNLMSILVDTAFSFLFGKVKAHLVY